MNKRISPEIRSTEILAWRAGALAKRQSDFLAHEEPLEILVVDRTLATTMRTPGHDKELAVGFLVTEGVVRNRADLLQVTHPSLPRNGGNIISVELVPGIDLKPESTQRFGTISTSCGICGEGPREGDPFVIDHILPRARGGSDEPSNLQAALVTAVLSLQLCATAECDSWSELAWP